MEKRIIPARLDCLDDATGFVEQILERAGFSEEKILQVHLAAEEIFVNIVSYAYPSGEGEAELRCELLQTPDRVRITFVDSGEPFDPLAQEDADTSEEGLLGREGGLGILLIKKLMDHVSYRYVNGKNELTIEKRK
ncbi:MAG: ATP-binding protein [Lachnospiraceae bacterium]|nr:ATP-binding protein [Lachnospiraceae bacterium]